MNITVSDGPTRDSRAVAIATENKFEPNPKQRESLEAAVTELLSAVVRLGSRGGLSPHEFRECFDQALVSAFERHVRSIEHREVSDERLSIYCGLTKSHVRRIREDSRHSLLSRAELTLRLSEILSVWHSEPEYSSVYGLPLRLAVRGEKGSFESIAKRVLPELPLDQVISALVSGGAVTLSDNKAEATANSRSMRMNWDNSLQFDRLAMVGPAFIDTLTNNIFAKEDGAVPLYEGVAMSERMISMKAFEGFLESARVAGREFLHSQDQALNSAPEELTVSQEMAHAGIGVYVVRPGTASHRALARAN